MSMVARDVAVPGAEMLQATSLVTTHVFDSDGSLVRQGTEGSSAAASDAPLGMAAARAAEAMSDGSHCPPFLVRDPARDRVWVVEARRIAEDPFRGELMIVDASLAARAERSVLLRHTAHEMGNHCAAFLALLDSLALETDANGDAFVQECVAHLRSVYERLAAHAHGLRFAAHPERSARKKVTVGTFLDAATALFPVPKDRVCPLRVDPEARDEWLLIDAVALSAVVAAFVDNAFRHGGESVSVSFEATCSGTEVDRTVAFVVADDGPGLADETLPYLWEPHSRHRSGGVGLTFVVARAVVLAHGGQLIAERATPRGFRAGMRLPVAR